MPISKCWALHVTRIQIINALSCWHLDVCPEFWKQGIEYDFMWHLVCCRAIAIHKLWLAFALQYTHYWNLTLWAFQLSPRSTDSRIYWFLSRNEKDTHFSFFLFHGEQHPRKFIIYFEFILFLYNNFKLRWLKDVNPLRTLSSVTISMAAGIQVHGPTKFQPETFAPTR